MRNIFIWYAICLHWLWGAILLSSSAPLGITAISSITNFGVISSSYIGIFYLTVAFLAMMGLAVPRKVGVFFLFPQQLVLITSAIGAIGAMSRGMFLDGTMRPTTFIIADQAPVIFAAIFHIINVYSSYFRADS